MRDVVLKESLCVSVAYFVRSFGAFRVGRGIGVGREQGEDMWEDSHGSPTAVRVTTNNRSGLTSFSSRPPPPPRQPLSALRVTFH